MSLLQGVPSRFWQLAPNRVIHNRLDVGTTILTHTVDVKTRAIYMSYPEGQGNRQVYFRIDNVPVTVDNGMYFPSRFPTWWYVEPYIDDASNQLVGVTFQFIANGAATDLTLLEVFA